MNCPQCGGESRVTAVDHKKSTHPGHDKIRRYRRCTCCGHKFRTTQAQERLDTYGTLYRKERPHFQGTNHGLAKLDEAKVQEIRAWYKDGNVTYQQIANRFGVGKHAIRKVVLRLTWAHV
jgi:transcriptional regulator NrdR family protein